MLFLYGRAGPLPASGRDFLVGPDIGAHVMSTLLRETETGGIGSIQGLAGTLLEVSGLA